MFRIVFQSGSLKGRRFVVRGGMVTMGRGEDNTIPLPDETLLAERHLSLERVKGRIQMRPLHPAMPVYVNGEPQSEPVVLREQDMVRCGGVEFQCQQVQGDSTHRRRRVSKTHALTITAVVLVVGAELLLLIGTSWWSESPLPAGEGPVPGQSEYPLVTAAASGDPDAIEVPEPLPRMEGDPDPVPMDPPVAPSVIPGDPNPVPAVEPDPEPEPEPEPEPPPFTIERIDDHAYASTGETASTLRILYVYLDQTPDVSPVDEAELYFQVAFFGISEDEGRVVLEAGVPDNEDPLTSSVDRLGERYYLASVFEPKPSSGIRYAGYAVRLFHKDVLLDEVSAIERAL